MKKLLPLFFFLLIGFSGVGQEDNFHFTQLKSTGATEDIKISLPKSGLEKKGDYTDNLLYINKSTVDFDDLKFVSSFTQKAYIKMWINGPGAEGPWIEIVNSGDKVDPPFVLSAGDLQSVLGDARNGTYTLRIAGSAKNRPTENAERDTTFSEVIDLTLMVDAGEDEENLEKEEFSYYPNPVKTQLNLRAPEPIRSVKLYNVLGQQVLSYTPNNTDFQLNMKNLDSGIYIMKVSLNGSQKSYKVVKK